MFLLCNLTPCIINLTAPQLTIYDECMWPLLQSEVSPLDHPSPHQCHSVHLPGWLQLCHLPLRGECGKHWSCLPEKLSECPSLWMERRMATHHILSGIHIFKYNQPGHTYIRQCSYSKFRHPCNSKATLKTTLVLLYKLFQYSCLWLIELTTCVVVVWAAFLLQRCLNLLYYCSTI